LTYSPLQQKSGRRIIRNCLPPLASVVQEALQPSIWSTVIAAATLSSLTGILAAADVTFFIDAMLIKCRASTENRNQIQHRSAAREREEKLQKRENGEEIK
ncbi:unnamed protein product, partial [Brassica oleracea var. botrytis]